MTKLLTLCALSLGIAFASTSYAADERPKDDSKKTDETVKKNAGLHESGASAKSTTAIHSYADAAADSSKLTDPASRESIRNGFVTMVHQGVVSEATLKALYEKAGAKNELAIESLGMFAKAAAKGKTAKTDWYVENTDSAGKVTARGDASGFLDTELVKSVSGGWNDGVGQLKQTIELTSKNIDAGMRPGQALVEALKSHGIDVDVENFMKKCGVKPVA